MPQDDRPLAEDITTPGEPPVDIAEIATVGEEAPDFSLNNAAGEYQLCGKIDFVPGLVILRQRRPRRYAFGR